MTVFLVSYDLREPGQDYSGLIEELKASEAWWHHLRSTWLVSTKETADELYARLDEHLAENDRLIVLELAKHAPRQGWLPEQAWTWVDKKLGKPRSQG